MAVRVVEILQRRDCLKACMAAAGAAAVGAFAGAMTDSNRWRSAAGHGCS